MSKRKHQEMDEDDIRTKENRGESWKRSLKKCRVQIVNTLETETVLDFIIQEDFFPDVLIADIRELTTNTAKNRKILEALNNRDLEAYAKFKQCIKSARQGHLVTALEDAERRLSLEDDVKSHAEEKPIKDKSGTSVTERKIMHNIGNVEGGNLFTRTIKEINTTNQYKFKETTVQVNVLAVVDRTKEKFSATLADSTGCILASVSNTMRQIMENALNTSTTLRITDFLLTKNGMHITNMTSVLRTHANIVISQSIKDAAISLITSTTTVDAIKRSPRKTRVNIKGKIIKVSPLQQRQINKDTVPLLTVHIKDRTGVIPVSLWGKHANNMSSVRRGECINVKQGVRSTFQGEPTINTWEDSTEIELLHEEINISDTEIDTADTLFKIGEILSIGNVHQYLACNNRTCYYKKLEMSRCPTCFNIINEPATAYRASLGIMVNNSIIDGTIFTDTIKSVFTHLMPSCSLPTAEKIEDELFKRLPLACSFIITPNNIFTKIILM